VNRREDGQGRCGAKAGAGKGNVVEGGVAEGFSSFFFPSKESRLATTVIFTIFFFHDILYTLIKKVSIPRTNEQNQKCAYAARRKMAKMRQKERLVTGRCEPQTMLL